MEEKFYKHNPAFLSPEELRTIFVVRQHELDTVLEIIRENTGPANQHALIIGHRGMGKTMLVRKVAQAVQDDRELASTWHPIIMAEEVYTVSSEGELWLEALRMLSRTDTSDPARWQAMHEQLRTEKDERRLRDAALAKLVDYSRTTGRRLLVVVENLNMIFNEQASSDMGWNLRKTLLEHPEIMLLATATNRFDAIENIKNALYELFRDITLSPLNTQACRMLWQAITTMDLSNKKIRPVEILTGGNPRLLTILASFAVKSSFKDLMLDLSVLIDDHTTYFKANVEALPALERRVFVTLADIWEPAGAREVADLCRLDINRTSALLQRLESRGAVVEVKRKGRKKIYQVAERLYNIYHLCRQSTSMADRAKAVVEFMVRYYEPAKVAYSIACDACLADADYRTALIEAYRYLYEKSVVDEQCKIIKYTPKEFFTITGFDQDWNKPYQPADKGVGIKSTLTDELKQLADELNKLLASDLDLDEQEVGHKLLNIFDNVIEKIGMNADSSDNALIIVTALIGKGLTLCSLSQTADAIAVFGDVIKRFDVREEASIAEQVAKALIFKGITLGSLGRSEEEIAVYDEMVARFGAREETPIAEQVAKALVNKGITLGSLGRSEEEIAVYDEMLARFGAREETPIAEQAAKALVRRGVALESLGRSEEAYTVYDDVVARYGAREEAPINEQVAKALVRRGVALGSLGRSEEAIVVFDDMLARFDKREEPFFTEGVVMALVSKGVALEDLGRTDEAMVLFDEAIGRSGNKDNELMSRVSALAIHGIGRLGNWQKALEDLIKKVSPVIFEQAQEILMNLFLDACANGQERMVLDTLTKSVEASARLEPLIVALKILCNEEYRAPQEVEAVAQDIIKDIEERRAKLPSSNKVLASRNSNRGSKKRKASKVAAHRNEENLKQE